MCCRFFIITSCRNQERKPFFQPPACLSLNLAQIHRSGPEIQNNDGDIHNNNSSFLDVCMCKYVCLCVSLCVLWHAPVCACSLTHACMCTGQRLILSVFLFHCLPYLLWYRVLHRTWDSPFWLDRLEENSRYLPTFISQLWGYNHVLAWMLCWWQNLNSNQLSLRV